MKINLILVVALLAVNCKVDGAGFCSLSAVTYNTALRDRSIDSEYTIPNNRLERRDEIIQMLIASEADVICLQEVWIGEDVKAIVDGVVATFPHSYSKIHKFGSINNGYRGPNAGPLCDFLKLFAVTDCVSGACSSATTLEDYWTCMNTQCSSEYTTFIIDSSENCITCVITALPNVTGIFELCSGAGIDDNFRKINSPGLLLLSRDPLRIRSYTSFHTQKQIITRGYLKAKVRGITLLCTQLSEEIVTFYPEVNIPSAIMAFSYSDQNTNEADNLNSTFAAVDPVLILGDFNSGLSGDDMNATIQASHTLLASEFTTQSVSECTVCDRAENPYTVANENYITDGFFGNGIKIRDIKRVFTEDDGSISYNSGTLPLSDHFGVEAIITKDD